LAKSYGFNLDASALGYSSGYKNESEYLAHQAQIEFMERIIDKGLFNGENPAADDMALLESALSDVRAMQGRFSHTPDS
jgi:hypothetical protein